MTFDDLPADMDGTGAVQRAVEPGETFTYRFVVWQAKALGIPLRMPPEHPFNPLPLLRLNQKF